MAKRKQVNVSGHTPQNHNIGQSIKDAAKRLIRNSTHLAGKKASSHSLTQNSMLNNGQRRLGDRIQIPATTNPIAQDLERDIFWALVTSGNKIHQRNQPVTGRELNKILLERIASSPTFISKSKQLIGNYLTAAPIAHEIITELLEDDDIREMMEQISNQLGEQNENNNSDGNNQGGNKGNNQENQERENEEDQGEDESGDESEGEDESGNNGGQDLSNDLKQRIQQYENQLKSEGIAGEKGMLIGGSVSEGMTKGDEIKKFITALGYSERDLAQKDMDNIVSLLKAGKLEKLANMIGRAYGAAKEVLKGHSTVEVVVDEAGDTKLIHDIFDDEFALMSPVVNDGVRREQISRYARHGLPGVTRVGQSERGGIKVFAIDESGSTDDTFRDSNNNITKYKIGEIERGFVLGLGRAAKSLNQKWYAFGYSGNSEVTETISSKDSVAKICDFLAYDLGGNTSFATALGNSMRIIENLPEDDRYKADITILTDGQGYIDEDTIQSYKDFKLKYGTRLYLITIGQGSYGKLESVADYLIEFKNMDDATTNIAKKLWIDQNQVKKEKKKK